MSLLQRRLFFRIISKSREVYLLKIITLAIAFACSTLIILFSLNEFGYDRFHNDYHSIFRILQRNNSESYSGNRLSNRIPPKVFSTLRTDFADSLIVSRMKVMDELNIMSGKQVFENQKIHVTDAEITNIFSFDILDGSLNEFHAGKRTLLLSSSAALKYFGTVQATGRELKIYTSGDTLLYTVVAVFKDFPQNSHEAFDLLVRFDDASIRTLRFNPNDAGVYGKMLHANQSLSARSINNLFPGDLVYRFQPIAEIYFGPRVIGEDATHGDHYSILILVCITALILFLALTSFINLTTLTLPHRSKELAIKKLAGTTNLNLLFSFAAESFSIVGISLLLGILLLLLTSDLIEPILGLDLIALLQRGDPLLIIILTSLLLILGIAPLFMTLKFTKATPNRLLSTETITFPRFKRIITFLQLGISIFLIVASMVIKRQINYSLLKEPGRNYDQVVYTSYPDDLTAEGLRNIRDGWKKYNPNIVDVIATSQLPDRINSKEINSDFYFMSVDPVFIDFFNLQMIEGKWFRPNAGDSIIIVNERGKELLRGNNSNVIGVFGDISGQFNKPEKPVKLNIAPYFNYNFLCIRILEVDIRRTVKFLSTFYDGTKVPVSYLNKRFEEWLTYQDRLNTLSDILAIISGLLSCCAIYGLSVSIVNDKLKQIAIHKLYGASILNITRLLVREFARQMFIAVLIFGPFTYIVLKELLRSFVYTTHFNWLDPLLPLAYCGIVITILCGFQAMSLNRKDLTGALKG